jgi:hypothetical protein
MPEPLNPPCGRCERFNTPFDQCLEIIRRIGMRKTHGRLHGSQAVKGAQSDPDELLDARSRTAHPRP